MADHWIFLADPARLRTTRLAHGFSQARLARRIRVSRQFISRLESGSRTAMSPEIAYRLALAFGATVESAFRQGFYTEVRPSHDPNGKGEAVFPKARARRRRRILDWERVLKHRRRDYRVIRSALQHAVKVGRVTSNVADRATPPSAGEAKAEEMRTWTSEQLGRFLSEIPEDRYRPALVFLATTGCRRGEALGLRWQDVALEEGRASIRQTITAVGHEIHAATRTKAGKRKGRQVELDARTVAVLRSWKAHHAKERLAMGEGYQDSGLVFCHPDGRPLHPEQFSREFEKRVRSVGLPAIRLHDLRHTWATLALKAGISVKVVSERLGHRSTLITSDIYSHVTPTMQRMSGSPWNFGDGSTDGLRNLNTCL